jgi:hypothetical protein
VAATALLLLGAGTPPAPAVDRVVSDPRITESSGLAESLRRPGLLWTHDDSGGPPMLFAIGADGRTAATLTLLDVTARDWEAMAALRGPDRTPWLAVGDIGDNTASRDHIEVVLTREPDAVLDARVRPPVTLRLRYPDGPVDAEALLADPRDQRLYVVTKTPTGGMLHAVPPALWPGGGAPTDGTPSPVTALEPVARVPLALVTDGAFLADGRVLLRSYTTLVVMPPPEQAPAGRWEPVATATLPLQPQGESLAVTAGGRVLVGSEGVSQPLLRVEVPRAGADATASTAPPPVPDPSTATGATAPTIAAATVGDGTGSGSRTRWLVVAAAVFLAAGALLAARRRR